MAEWGRSTGSALSILDLSLSPLSFRLREIRRGQVCISDSRKGIRNGWQMADSQADKRGQSHPRSPGPEDLLPDLGGDRSGRGRRVLPGEGGRVLCTRRRVRVRKERNRPFDHPARPEPFRVYSGRGNRVPGEGHRAHPGDGKADAARQRDLHDLSGADDQPESRLHRGATAHRGDAAAPGPGPEGGTGRGAPDAGTGEDAGTRPAVEGVPPPALGRDETAGDDRHGPGLSSRAPDRR